MIAKIEQPMLRKTLEKRGFQPRKLVAEAIFRTECRKDNTVPLKKRWIERYVNGGGFEQDNGLELTEGERTLAIKAMKSVMTRIKARNKESADSRLYSKMAYNKLKYPKELTVYEISYIAKKMGIAEKLLLENIFDGFGILGDYSEKKETLEGRLEQRIESLLQELSESKLREKELKQTIRELRISRTNLKKEIQTLKDGGGS